FLTRLNSERSAKHADLVIRPDLEGISSGDFVAVPDAIPLGEAAAEAMRPALERLALDEQSWQEALERRPLQERPAGTVTSVRVEGNERIDSRKIVAYGRISPGDPVSVAS